MSDILNEEEQQEVAQKLKNEKKGAADEALKKVLEKNPYGKAAVVAGKMVGVDVASIVKKIFLYIVIPFVIFLFVIIVLGGYFLTMNLLELLKLWWL